VKRKWDTSSLELTTGTDKLQPLHKGETVELTLGAARTGGVINGAVLRKDELDWELIFRQGAKEIARFSSKSNFQTLLKRAALVPTPVNPAAEAAPAPAAPTTPATSAAPVAPAAPGTPAPATPVPPAPAK
jgi:hypothetical protein